MKLQEDLNSSAKAGDIGGIRSALAAGAEINPAYWKRNESHLQLAIDSGQFLAATFLLDNGARWKWGDHFAHSIFSHLTVPILDPDDFPDRAKFLLEMFERFKHEMGADDLRLLESWVDEMLDPLPDSWTDHPDAVALIEAVFFELVWL